LVEELFVVNEAWPAEPEPVAAFCMLAPWALKAERKLPKKGRFVVGMLDMWAALLLLLLLLSLLVVAVPRVLALRRFL
jgi:hypothetical protein